MQSVVLSNLAHHASSDVASLKFTKECRFQLRREVDGTEPGTLNSLPSMLGRKNTDSPRKSSTTDLPKSTHQFAFGPPTKSSHSRSSQTCRKTSFNPWSPTFTEQCTEIGTLALEYNFDLRLRMFALAHVVFTLHLVDSATRLAKGL